MSDVENTKFGNVDFSKAKDMTKLLATVKAEAKAENEAKATVLPTPVGYKILCAVPEADKTYDNGLLKADQTVRNEEVSTTVLFVLKIGDMAYKDAAKFPTGPWCQEGDFVLVRAYTGTRFKIHGKEFRIINDDGIEGVVEDPRGIVRI